MKIQTILLLLLSAVCVWAADLTPAPANGKGKSSLARRKTARPVYQKLTFVPGFAGCSFYYPAANGNKIEVTFREAGKGEFKPVLTPSYNRREKLWRGSIVNLKENTVYELRIVTDKGVAYASRCNGKLPQAVELEVQKRAFYRAEIYDITNCEWVAHGNPIWLEYETEEQ